MSLWSVWQNQRCQVFFGGGEGVKVGFQCGTRMLFSFLTIWGFFLMHNTFFPPNQNFEPYQSTFQFSVSSQHPSQLFNLQQINLESKLLQRQFSSGIGKVELKPIFHHMLVALCHSIKCDCVLWFFVLHLIQLVCFTTVFNCMYLHIGCIFLNV